MIVISRKRDEAISIGDDIIVTIVDIRGDKVRLGIQHPPEVPVHRPEVLEAMRRENTRPAFSEAPPAVATPQPHFAAPAGDRMDRFVAILEVKVGVPIKREQIVSALREAGLEISDVGAGVK